jgi:hypothetical protein
MTIRALTRATRFDWSRHNLLARVDNTGTQVVLSLLPLRGKSHSTTLILPLAPDESIHYLSFAPSGSSLLIAASGKHTVRLFYAEISASYCINEWEIKHEWALPQSDVFAQVLAVEWLSQPREVRLVILVWIAVVKDLKGLPFIFSSESSTRSSTWLLAFQS